jgi:hypothetical protein
MKPTIVSLPAGASIPEGAVRVHLGSPETALAPRGSMMKNSLGDTIYRQVESAFDHWSDSAYADCPHAHDLFEILANQAHVELRAALNQIKTEKGIPD